MTPKKILVPFGLGSGDLQSVHHGLALAERLHAHVVILQWNESPGSRHARASWLGEALADVITNARLAGLSLSHLTASGRPDTEIAGVVEEEGIDLLVLSSDQSRLESALLQRRPQLAAHIIRVKEKETMERPEKEGGRRWPS